MKGVTGPFGDNDFRLLSRRAIRFEHTPQCGNERTYCAGSAGRRIDPEVVDNHVHGNNTAAGDDETSEDRSVSWTLQIDLV